MGFGLQHLRSVCVWRDRVCRVSVICGCMLSCFDKNRYIARGTWFYHLSVLVHVFRIFALTGKITRRTVLAADAKTARLFVGIYG